ncbi:MAG TPA: ECF transporter S component [bacterium]|nr:ECF transporter S component [bacterium]
MSNRDLVYGALLTALSLLIPIAFGNYLRVYLPPFSATLTSHVPVMLAMLVSPTIAVLVGVGSTIGFLIVLGPVIAARAAVHVLVGFIGAVIIARKNSFATALLVTAPIHAIGEAVVVLPFGFTLYQAWFLVGIGTILHHGADALISVAIATSLKVAHSSYTHGR